MSATTINQVRKGFYIDSVALMRLSHTLRDIEGVQDAALMMGTPANKQLLSDAGLLTEMGDAASGGDLIVAICADDDATANNAIDIAAQQLEQPAARSEATSTWQPRTLRSAHQALPGANLALISVPGDFAVAEARKAIRSGLHAMIFSDNVSLEEEAELKAEARDLGRLVMGPDCGTAIVNGVPLAFANQVPRGEIGIVGASGTGIQEVSCLIAHQGGGISHAIGVGGRDLNARVGGVTTLMAIDALATDDSTKHIVLISKPPAEAVATLVLDRIAASGKPATVCFAGAQPMSMPAGARQVFSLKDAAHSAVGQKKSETQRLPGPLAGSQRTGLVQGLFAGGTLCVEAQAVFSAAGATVSSNVPIQGVQTYQEGVDGHILLDLGDDRYTRGRPHPMIDPAVRTLLLADVLGNEFVGAVLLDVVLGFGAHADPAAAICETIEAHGKEAGPPVIASVTGTDGDPQVRSRQVAMLEAAGVHVAASNADAAAWALAVVTADG